MLAQVAKAEHLAREFHCRLTEAGIKLGDGAYCDEIICETAEQSETVTRIFKEVLECCG